MAGWWASNVSVPSCQWICKDKSSPAWLVHSNDSASLREMHIEWTRQGYSWNL